VVLWLVLCDSVVWYCGWCVVVLWLVFCGWCYVVMIMVMVVQIQNCKHVKYEYGILERSTTTMIYVLPYL